MMDINFKKYLKMIVMTLVFSSILFASDAFAEDTAVFSSLTGTGWEIFKGMRQIIWGAAGFGIIAVAIGGLFGALNWKWLSAIFIGLVVIGLTAGLVQYLTAGTSADVSVAGITDTLK